MSFNVQDGKEQGGCEHLEKLKGKPEECSPEQIRECHGKVKGLLAISYCGNCLYK